MMSIVPLPPLLSRSLKSPEKKSPEKPRSTGSEPTSLPFRLVVLFTLCLALGSCVKSPEPVNLSSLESKVRDLLALSTYEYVYRDVIYLGEEAWFIEIFKTVDKRLLFSVDVIVRAGIDLQKGFSVVELPGKGQAIEITLPKAEILSVDADEGSIHQYFSKEMGGAISRLEYYEEIDRKKDDIRADAIQRGILSQAENNGKKIISRLFTAAGIGEITYRWIEEEGLKEF